MRELQRLLPGEDIIYYGDSANCPYGDKTAEQLFQLSSRMLRFLSERQVKCTAVAATRSPPCWTACPCFNHDIIGVIDGTANYVIREKLQHVGLVATEFTVSTGRYAQMIHRSNPDCHVVSRWSSKLAVMIDQGVQDDEEIDEEIRTQVDQILACEPVDHLILGCTHYPIVEENFQHCYPNITMINPALKQAIEVKAFLEKHDAVNPQAKGRFTVYTSGDPQVYIDVAKRLDLFEPDEVAVLQI